MACVVVMTLLSGPLDGHAEAKRKPVFPVQTNQTTLPVQFLNWEQFGELSEENRTLYFLYLNLMGVVAQEIRYPNQRIWLSPKVASRQDFIDSADLMNVLNRIFASNEAHAFLPLVVTLVRVCLTACRVGAQMLWSVARPALMNSGRTVALQAVRSAPQVARLEQSAVNAARLPVARSSGNLATQGTRGLADVEGVFSGAVRGGATSESAGASGALKNIGPGRLTEYNKAYQAVQGVDNLTQGAPNSEQMDSSAQNNTASTTPPNCDPGLTGACAAPASQPQSTPNTSAQSGDKKVEPNSPPPDSPPQRKIDRKKGEPCLFGLYDATYEAEGDGGCRAPKGTMNARSCDGVKKPSFACNDFDLWKSNKGQKKKMCVHLNDPTTMKDLSVKCSEKLVDALTKDPELRQIQKKDYENLKDKVEKLINKPGEGRMSLAEYCGKDFKNEANSHRQEKECTALRSLTKIIEEKVGNHPVPGGAQPPEGQSSKAGQ